MKKVLIVEDDKYLANAYRLRLENTANFEVKIVGDGEEALRQIADFTPDLILLDLILPKKDGFSILEEIRKHDSWKQIPVIIATNLGQEEDVQKGMKLGAADYIIKSNMEIDDIVNKISKILNK